MTKILTALIVFFLSLEPAFATPAIIWGQYDGKIRAAQLDGSAKEDLVTGLGDAHSVAVDVTNSKLIYNAPSAQTLAISDLDGSNESTIVSGSNTYYYGIAVDPTNQYIYYTNLSNSKLTRVAYDGTGSTQLATVSSPLQLSLDTANGLIYVASNTSVVSVPIGGGSPTTVKSVAGQVHGIAYVSATSHIFYTLGTTVHRMNSDGTGDTTVVTGLNNPYGIAVDSTETYIYIADSNDDAIYRASASDGSGLTAVVSSAHAYSVAIGDLTFPTPTPTPTNTPTATSTSTVTPTPTATATSTNTPLPTNTAAASPTAAATPTSAIRPTVTPTAVPTGVVAGRIVDANGDPAANIPVYLYQQGQSQKSRVRTIDSDGEVRDLNNETGVLSTVTDSDGNYHFDNVPSGTYQLVPNRNDLTFQPSTVTVAAGSAASEIVATTMDLNDAGCARSDRTADVLTADAAGRSQLDYALSLLDRLVPTKRSALRTSLLRARQHLKDGFTRILHTSETLPKIIISCPNRPDCTTKRYQSTVQSYKAQLLNIRRLSLFVLRRSRGNTTKFTDTLDQHAELHIISLSTRAVNRSKRLPKMNADCRG